MRIFNKYISISWHETRLKVVQRELDKVMELDWPAVRIRLDGKEVRPCLPSAPPRITTHSISQFFECGGLTFKVCIALSQNRWFWKTVEVVSQNEEQTPEFLEVDHQTLTGDGLERCGYLPGEGNIDKPNQREEEGSGSIPGCGYPLIGKTLFFGLEHPAAFNAVEKDAKRQRIRLWHHPVWVTDRLAGISEVIGWARDARKNFADYLDSIRLPTLPSPLVCFGTFWTDPFLGNGNFETSFESIRSFIDGFDKLKLFPGYFTLDAGWQDRKSILRPKKSIGEDPGLARIKRILDRRKIGLSLWISHNGHVAFDPEYLKKKGFHVGSGSGACYQGDNFAVMMDSRFEKTLADRLDQLVKRHKVGHFKIDWDNECACNDSFKVRYPTPNHVRQAGIDAFIRIGTSLRKRNPRLVLRNGWWPSPWWLKEVNHIWLSDSGDSEYCSLPSRTQRDAATTHRDLMYYNILQRDKSPVPLDCLDHHELADAPRNPFVEDPISWTNALWLCFMRGSTYIPFTLMPESLEDWQVDSLKAIGQFARAYAKHIFVRRGRMILGHPGKGQIYGFIQPGLSEFWCILRNPLPIPQRIEIDGSFLADHPVREMFQFYPHCEHLRGKQELTFLGHEVKILILSSTPGKSLFPHPYKVARQNGRYLYYLPGSVEINDRVSPLGHRTQRVSKLECLESKHHKKGNVETHWWSLAVPHRMRQFELQVALRTGNSEAVTVRAFGSRYTGESRMYVLPVTTIPAGLPGHGERKNPTDGNGMTYYTVAVPDGGRLGLTLEISGYRPAKREISAWLAGFEAPGRIAIAERFPPRLLAKGLPYQHPLGFGRAIPLNTSDEEVKIEKT
jgi:hypothetical protein